MAYMPHGERATTNLKKIPWLFRGDHSVSFARFGLTERNSEWLGTILFDIARNADYVDTVDSNFGRKYYFYELVITPDGK